MTLSYRRLLSTALLVPALALAATGCVSEAPPSGTATATSAPAGEEASTFAVTDAWVKATDEGMTGAFGVLSNSGDRDIQVIGATSDAAGMVELHEVVENDDGEMTMREKTGGFLIPAGSEHTLEPGADHVMLMQLTDPLEAGDEVTITLSFADGSTADVTATVKDFSGANETYEG
ncbi:MAG: copper chaperone PCu(A)C [Propioniciclava sp.]